MLCSDQASYMLFPKLQSATLNFRTCVLFHTLIFDILKISSIFNHTSAFLFRVAPLSPWSLVALFIFLHNSQLILEKLWFLSILPCLPWSARNLQALTPPSDGLIGTSCGWLFCICNYFDLSFMKAYIKKSFLKSLDCFFRLCFGCSFHANYMYRYTSFSMTWHNAWRVHMWTCVSGMFSTGQKVISSCALESFLSCSSAFKTCDGAIL